MCFFGTELLWDQAGQKFLSTPDEYLFNFQVLHEALGQLDKCSMMSSCNKTQTRSIWPHPSYVHRHTVAKAPRKDFSKIVMIKLYLKKLMKLTIVTAVNTGKQLCHRLK